MSAPSPAPARRAALIYNPTKVDRDRLRAQVTHYSRLAGWERPIFFETRIDDLGDEAAGLALEEGVDVVLVAGGDGTVRAVAHALAGRRVPLAIVPSGTGNLLARNLFLPLDDPERIIRAAFDGEVRPVDIGLARITRPDGSETVQGFVVMAGMGLDAAMIANTRPELKRAVGWVAYVDGAARSLPRARSFRIVYEIDGHRLHAARVHSMLVANCGMLPAGIALIPDASVTDGLLDVAIIQPTGWFGWVGVWRKVWWDNTVLRRSRAGRRVLQRRGRDTSVRFRRGESVDVATVPAQPVELDGDEFGEAVRMVSRVLPGALQVIVPHGHRAAP